MPDAHGAEADVDVGEADPEKAGPRPFFVRSVEEADGVVEPVTDGVLGDGVEGASDEMTEGVATEDVSAEQDYVDRQNQAAKADAEAVGEVE